jgi:hypothetical protein
MIDRRWRVVLAWMAVAALTVGLASWNVRRSLVRYRELNTGWSWDLAYYNQWFWALTKGDGVLSVRPQSSYGSEGPSIWRANYLTPIRLAIAPIYRWRPGPETLLAVEAAIFWLVVPAAFVLAWGESRSIAVGLAAACLVPLTPLFVPLAANDFRELQIALPFALLAVEGVRGRRLGLAALGIGGLLACRQEFGLMVALMALVPPRVPEDLGQTARWARATWLVGVGWTLLFLFYLAVTRSPVIPEMYLQQFAGTKAPIGQTLATLADLLMVGLGAWGVLILGVPRMALLVLPWAWSLASGRWALRYLAAEEWHHVRYAAPFVAIGVASGVLGFARLMGSLGGRLRAARIAAQVGLVAITAVGLLAGRAEVESRFDRAPRPVSREEAEGLWPWIDRVGPDEGVMADYKVTAPLSSRRLLRSYILAPDRPPGYPALGPEYRWVFARPAEVPSENWTGQGFEVVHRGETIWVFHRPEGASAPVTIAERPIQTLPHPFIRLDDIGRLWVVPALGLLLWPWNRLRLAWRAASGQTAGKSGLDVAGDRSEVVVDAPRDLADPARGVVRLGRATAGSGQVSACTIAAVEAAHLDIALTPGPLGWLARWRPSLVIGSRLATASGLLTILTGLASGSRYVLDLGLIGYFISACVPLVAYPLERLAARRTSADPLDLDARLLAALTWRHVVEAVPIPWRRPGGTPRR